MAAATHQGPAMPPDPARRAPYTTRPLPATNAADRPPAPASSTVAEPPPPEYHIAPAWIDTAGRTRTWALKNPHGTQMAEITTKSAALKLAQLLNSVMGDERGPAR